MTPRARRWLGVLVLLAIVGPAMIDWLWTSDEERVITALRGIEQGLEARDAAAIAEWFAADVVVTRPIPYLQVRKGLTEALRATLARLESLSVDFETTEMLFPEEGHAAVRVTGSGFAQLGAEGLGGSFLLSFDARLVRDGERFLLAELGTVKIEPGLH